MYNINMVRIYLDVNYQATLQRYGSFLLRFIDVEHTIQIFVTKLSIGTKTILKKSLK